MITTEEYRNRVWEYMAEHHPNHRIAWKGHGRAPWRYSTATTFSQDLRVDRNFFNHREVFPEELVADYDCDGEELLNNSRSLINRLEELGMSFSVWRTNGADDGGIHIHALYDIPANIADAAFLKRLLLKYLIGDYLSQSIDTQVLGKHLIRFEGGNYDKLPPNEARKKTLIYSYGDPLKKNKVPAAVWDTYANEILSWHLRSLRQQRKIDTIMNTPKSIQFILSPRFKEYHDGSKRAIFALASYYRKLPIDELRKLLREFSRYNSKEPITDAQLEKILERSRKEIKHPAGERYRRELIISIGAKNEVYGG